MKSKNKGFKNVFFWIFLAFLILICLFIIYLIFQELKYNQEIGKYLSNCKPNNLGIHENNIYHHTLPSCGNFYEKRYIREGKEEELDFNVKVSVNSLGFRNDEYPLEKSDNTFRLIFLGDSFTYGFGLEKENTFYKLLEKKLNLACKKEIEIWNIAVPSWGTPIHYLIVKNKLLNYSPDYVVLMLDASDFADTLFYEQEGIFIGEDLVGVPEKNQNWLDSRSKLKDNFFSNTNMGPEEKEILYRESTFEYLRKMKSYLNQNNLKLEIIIYPYPNFGDDDNFTLDLLDKGRFEYFDLYPFLKKEDRKEYYSLSHLHWNEEGSEYVAELLFNHLKGKKTFSNACNN